MLVWQRYKKMQPAANLAQANPDVNMDIGAIVQVQLWQTDNTCSVKYRGAHWDAALQEGQTAAPGPYVITEIIGSRLILKHANTH